jgi:MraZ protein
MSATSLNPPPFLGQWNYAVDEKGRVTIPFDWRSEEESETFYLVPDSKGACLRVMRPDRYTRFGEEARAKTKGDAALHRLFMRNFFATCAKVIADKQGRIAIPKEMCERFKLKGEVSLVGTEDLFEIWNKAANAARQKLETPQYQEIASAMGL